MSAVMDCEGLEARLAGYIAALADIAAKEFSERYKNLKPPVFSLDIGNRYVRVVRSDGCSRSVHSFVDRANGNILKAASWKAPEKKHPRGNVYDEDFGIKSSGANWIGVRYLR